MRPTPLPAAAERLPGLLALSLRRALALVWSSGGKLLPVAIDPDGTRHPLGAIGARALAPTAWTTLSDRPAGSRIAVVPIVRDLRQVIPGVWRSTGDDGCATDAFVALLDKSSAAATLNQPAAGYGPDATVHTQDSAAPAGTVSVAEIYLEDLPELGATVALLQWGPVASAFPAISHPILTAALAAVTRAEAERALAHLGAA